MEQNTVYKSFKENNIKECILGKGIYRQRDRFDPSPINYKVILGEIYEIYIKYPDLDIEHIFYSVLENLCDNDCNEIYIAFYYVYLMLSADGNGITAYSEHRGSYHIKSTFTFNNQILLDKLAESIQNHKKDFMLLKNLPSVGVYDNVYDRIMNLSRECQRKTGKIIFSDMKQKSEQIYSAINENQFLDCILYRGKYIDYPDCKINFNFTLESLYDLNLCHPELQISTRFFNVLSLLDLNEVENIYVLAMYLYGIVCAENNGAVVSDGKRSYFIVSSFKFNIEPLKHKLSESIINYKDDLNKEYDLCNLGVVGNLYNILTEINSICCMKNNCGIFYEMNTNAKLVYTAVKNNEFQKCLFGLDEYNKFFCNGNLDYISILDGIYKLNICMPKIEISKLLFDEIMKLDFDVPENIFVVANYLYYIFLAERKGVHYSFNGDTKLLLATFKITTGNISLAIAKAFKRHPKEWEDLFVDLKLLDKKLKEEYRLLDLF